MTSAKKIRVLVVDDSTFMRAALRRLLQPVPDIEVVDAAADGKEALRKIAALRPDVVTLDLAMPNMSGMEVLHEVMRTAPVPIIIVSALTQEGADAAFQALAAGAFDCVSKGAPYSQFDIDHLRQDLVAKIRLAAASPRQHRTALRSEDTLYLRPAEFQRPRLICLGTSTGGPKALQQLIPALPSSLAVPLVVVQHMPAGFTGPFARRLNGLSNVCVSEAQADEVLEPGHVYIAPATWQLTFAHHSLSTIAVRLSKSPDNTPHIPSVDVMMLSAAALLRDRVMGVIMTGMGNDGEQGMRAIYEAGGYTIGQDEQSCTVFGMPRSCQEARVVRRVVPLESIAAEISAVASIQPRASILSPVAVTR